LVNANSSVTLRVSVGEPLSGKYSVLDSVLMRVRRTLPVVARFHSRNERSFSQGESTRWNSDLCSWWRKLIMAVWMGGKAASHCRAITELVDGYNQPFERRQDEVQP
jgi:hypothetical protein